jgi:hypothetical protein
MQRGASPHAEDTTTPAPSTPPDTVTLARPVLARALHNVEHCYETAVWYADLGKIDFSTVDLRPALRILRQALRTTSEAVPA